MTKSTKTQSIDFGGFISDEAFKTVVESTDIKDIVLKTQLGEPSAFNELDLTYRRHLLMVAFRKMDDRNYAKDLVQDVLKETFHSIIEDNNPDIDSDNFEQEMIGKMFKTLSYKIARIGSDDRRHKNDFENKSVSIENESVEVEDSAINSIPDETLNYLDGITESEKFSEVQRAVEALKGLSRKAVELSFYHQRATSDIAKDLMVSRETAKKLIKEGVKNLKKKLVVA